MDGTVSSTGVGHVIESVETIDTGYTASGVGAVDAVSRAYHTLAGGW